MLPRFPLTLSRIATLLALVASPGTRAAAQQETHGSATLGTVAGTVYDSLSGRPLVGAMVRLAASDLRGGVLGATTDSAGNFLVGGVQPGEYLVGFTHPFLDSLGLDVPPLKLRVDGSTTQLSLAIPTQRAVRSQICPVAQPTDSSGLMLGFLRDADSGAHLDSGSVVLEWTEVTVSADGKEIHAARRSASAQATGAGWYAICGVPTAGPVAAHATIAGRSSGVIDVRVPPGGVRHRDFLIPPQGAVLALVDASGDASADTLRRGRARLTVRVRGKDGRPLSGAQLTVDGSGVTGTTEDDGSFTLAGLPAGTRTLEVRHLGYAPEYAVVDLASDRTASTTVTLDKVAEVLSEVKVYGMESSASRRLAGFRQRMHAGFGHFITRADIERRAPLRFTDLLRGVPGVVVERSGNIDYKVVPSNPSSLCAAAVVYIDGHRVMRAVSKFDENSPSTAMVQIDTSSGGGAGPPQSRTPDAQALTGAQQMLVAGGHMTDNDFFPINDLIWLDQVVAIEVYSSGLFAPAEFSGADDCPRIIVWTSPDAAVLTQSKNDGS
ncbi:MAG TPA: carboxypeptidase regulatory-like domain-containing protein [Gemmatimonadaceae bacterium]|nr:carboxypeptidase regulatory-like domain-containing protein [Gemmatimonadaceae bacterium]